MRDTYLNALDNLARYRDHTHHTLKRCWRIEDDNGEGPYREHMGRSLYPFPDGNGDDTIRLDPADDGIPEPQLLGVGDVSDLVFGFATRWQLLTWFDGPRRDWLVRHDFHAAIYEPGLVLFGRHQIAFVPKRRCSSLKIKDIRP